MVTDTINRVRELIASGATTKSGLAVAVGLHPNTLRGVETDDWNPTAETLRKLEIHLTALEDVPV